MDKIAPTELGTEKISKLLRQYALPAIIAMTAASLYNTVDSIFIGHGVGPYAIAALALTFPLMNLSTAMGTLVGVGASTLISILLGQKNYTVAQKVLGNSVTLNVIVGILYAAVVILFLDPILEFFGGSENTIPYAREYMIIILLGNVITHLYFGLNSILRVLGFPKKAMIATIFTVLINSVLDPLFIFVFEWGIRGAAIATVLSQFLALLYVTKLISSNDRVVRLKKGIYKLERKIIEQTFKIGVSPFLMNSTSCIIVIILNQQLKRYGGDMAIGAFGIVQRLTFLVLMTILGLNQGMQPIAGYNFGANKVNRVNEVLRKTIFYATIVCIIGFVVCELFPNSMASIFTTDKELIEHAHVGIRINFLFFPIIGFQMVTSNFFQCIGMVRKAIFLSLSRQLICLLPLLYLLPLIFGHDRGILGVWWSLPISDLISSIITAIVLIRQYNKFKAQHASQLLSAEEIMNN